MVEEVVHVVLELSVGVVKVIVDKVLRVQLQVEVIVKAVVLIVAVHQK